MKMFSTLFRTGCSVTLLFTASQLNAQEQIVDENFDVEVNDPAYIEDGPIVAIDEAHCNFHTSTGRYQPFADLLRGDGYNVISMQNRFEPGAFSGIDVLVIANALPQDENNLSLPAFTDQECDILADWVLSGGSLLLIMDHAPFGDAGENLAGRFGVTMGKGWVFDKASDEGVTTHLVFSRDNGLLGNHPILSGRDPQEEINVIQAFTGQSICVPEGATALMQLSTSAREAETLDDFHAEDTAARNSDSAESFGARSISVAGCAQGVAMMYGRGRVVVLGEASLLSAQVIRFSDGREIEFGMNVPGNDNMQFGLNVLHWLSGLLNSSLDS